MRLLVIEDEIPLANSLAVFLRNQNYAVDVCYSCQDALNSRDFKQYDLIISDYLMPGLNGEEFIKEIRKNKLSLPILILSAVTSTENKTRLLNCGADDYLSKPFSGEELNSRISSLLRRRVLKKEAETNLYFADLSYNSNRGEAVRGGKIIYLTNKESLLLKYLLENAGKICLRRLITEYIWDESTCHLSNIIEAHILKLRKKIDFKKPLLIHTVCGRGYKIDLDV